MVGDDTTMGASTHRPGQQYPEPDVGRRTPVPDMGDIKAKLGPSRMSLRDLALGLQLGTVRMVDLTGQPDDPDTFLDQWLDRGTVAGGGSGGRYDPMKVYTSSTNRHDHRDQIRLNMPPDMLRAVRMIVGMVPQFGSEQGFMRDAILHSLQHWAKRLDGFIDVEVVNSINFATMNSVIGAMRDTLEERRRVIAEVDELLDMAIRDGDAGTVDLICDVHEVIAGQTPEPNRSKMLETVARGRRWVGEWRKQEAVRIAKEKIAAKEREAREAEWIAREAGEEMLAELDGMLDE